MEKRKKLQFEGVGERHHIIPKSLGGLNIKSNIIKLSSREHFISHCLLARMYPVGSIEYIKMNYALFCMDKKNNKTNTRYVNSKLYEASRLIVQADRAGKPNLAMSIRQTGEKNSNFGMRWIFNTVTKENKRIKNTDLVPEGWEYGRRNILPEWFRIENSKRFKGMTNRYSQECNKRRGESLKLYNQKKKLEESLLSTS